MAAGTEHRFEARVTWPKVAGTSTATTSFARDYALSLNDKPELLGSGPTVFQGNAAGLNPEEMFTASVTACHMLTYLALAAYRKLTVTSYEDHGTALLQKVGPGKLKFTEVVLRPRVKIAAGGDLALAQKLHHDAHEACFVANSVNFPIRVEASIEVG